MATKILLIENDQARAGRLSDTLEASGFEVRVGPQLLRVVNARGYNVAVWRENEIVYSLVSDLDEADLFELVRTAQQAR